METTSPILQCQGLYKLYSGVPALYDVSLSIPRGKIIGLLGPNGSGKTTLIKLAAGLLTPSQGTIFVDGKTPGSETKALVSYLPERTYLSSWMRVEDILRFFADFYADFDMDKAREMLNRLGISSDKKLKTLSKGTKEKVQLVLVMSRQAKLYLLDEPIGGVDPAARDYILETILSTYNRDATLLISTHLISEIENIIDEFIFIRHGQIMMQGEAEKVRSEEGKSIDQLFREVFRC